jgi:UDP-N-acetylglucosamine 4-epimerase
MAAYEALRETLRGNPKTWLVTGAAGFIGSNLTEALLRLDQRVVGLDNFATGFRKNLERIREAVSPPQWEGFRFREGDIRDLETCRQAAAGVDYVLHEAALGSVPRSLENPLNTNDTNICGFLNMLVACRDAGVKRLVYAASSSTYGDHPGLPKVEDRIGRPLSPYAVTKYVNELYADVFARCYDIQAIGLRYFNVFGPRQDPDGAYAAVIPKWFGSLLHEQPVCINGDGETSRDFCYVANVVQANLLAATVERPGAINQVYNVALGERTSLKELLQTIQGLIAQRREGMRMAAPVYREFRAGDVRHSQADITKAREWLGYAPTHTVRQGLVEAADWYIRNLQPA